MKNLTTIMCLVLTFTTVTSIAQSNSASRPSLFANYPSIIQCTEAQLSSLFNANVGQQVNASFAALNLSGPITSKEQRYSNLQIMVVKLPAFNNVLFSVSKRLDENNLPVYVGHILDNKYQDGYNLKRNNDGTYQFEKVEMGKIQPDCLH
ncbi:MAG: hypothetical protein ACOYKE_01880 [Ferruginibacter sp.]